MILATAVTCAALVALLLVEYKGRAAPSWQRWLFKPIASGGFVGVALAARPFDSAYGCAVLAGLAFAWFGDVLLIPTATGPFVAGLLFFLGAHVALAAAFVLRGVSVTWALIALPVVAVASGSVGRWLLPRAGSRSLRAAVAGYVGVLSTMVVLAVGTFGRAPSLFILAAAAAFYLSDLSVAFDRFGSREADRVPKAATSFRNRAWGLPLYYTAQLLFAWSLAER